MKKRALLWAVIIIISQVAAAQQQKLFELHGFSKAVEKQTRTRHGAPGALYWQNYSDYQLEAVIEPENDILRGKGTITYHNNSPDTIFSLRFQLYQNMNTKNAMRNLPIPDKSITDGIFLEKITIDEKEYIVDNKPVEGRFIFNMSTTLYIRLEEAIAPGEAGRVDLSWYFTIPVATSTLMRMGKYNDAWFMGLWYPQIAVYDDLNAWNFKMHTGAEEFYNDFNNYDIRITTPQGYVTWATGDCMNYDEVLAGTVRERMNQAATEDDMMVIMHPDDYTAENITGNHWHFKADNINDFAFVVARNFYWDGASFLNRATDTSRVPVHVIFREQNEHAQAAKEVVIPTLQHASQVYPAIPYPFSHATSFFNGNRNLVSMEFPMLINFSDYSEIPLHKVVVAHELLHNYMPFYMGFNETLHGWMDEGWTTFLEGKISSNLFYEFMLNEYEQMSGSEWDAPLLTSGNSTDMYTLNTNYYLKPVFTLMLLEELLGEERFLQATRDFMQTWNGKHPSPYDFFYTFSKYADKDITWFWNSCYMNYGYPDLGIKSVEKNRVTIARIGTFPVSIKMQVTYDDNSTESVYRSPAIWETGISEYRITLNSRKKIMSVTLGDSLTPDKNRKDNYYERMPAK
jgi:hypothetical protein